MNTSFKIKREVHVDHPQQETERVEASTNTFHYTQVSWSQILGLWKISRSNSAVEG